MRRNLPFSRSWTGEGGAKRRMRADRFPKYNSPALKGAENANELRCALSFCFTAAP